MIGAPTVKGRCSVCGTQWSSVWLQDGKRLYCDRHVPSRKTLRRKVRVARARTSANPTLGNTTSTKGPRLPKNAGEVLPKTGRERGPEVLASFATLRLELVKCGKPGCKKLHGPYWYGYWRTGPRVVKKYIGKHLPPSIASKRLAPRRQKRGSKMDARVLEELELEADE